MENLFSLGGALTLLIIGYVVGSFLEEKHYKSIRKRERKYKKIPAVNFQNPPEGELVSKSKLVKGSTVISIDYFKKFLAGLRLLVGGKLKSYESLVDRARRESILRMKANARGADMILNVRVETSSISKGTAKKGSIGSIEVLAYGTAVKFRKKTE